MFRNPITFGLFFLYFTTALAEGNRAPFDLPEAESELVAGYSTEYSGMRYLFFFFAEWANVFVMSRHRQRALPRRLADPGRLARRSRRRASRCSSSARSSSCSKSWFLIFVVIWIRWTLPRVRIDQMMNLCWKWFVPLSFVAFILTALWMVASVPSSRRARRSASRRSWSGACSLVHFIRRVQYNMRESRVPMHLNPFL